MGDGAYGATINTYTEYPIDGTDYIVTFDGTTYIARGHYSTSSILVLGDYYLTAGATYVEFPFAIILNGETLFYLAVQGSGTHTLKVDKILSYSGGGSSATLITKTITQNGTYLASSDNADGYSSVVVNVPSEGSTPSATAHTIVFEFTDSTSTTLIGYWDAAFITSAITATTPTEYGGKTVDSASLDGVAWYTKPTGTWVVLYTDSNVGFTPNSPEEGGSYCWIGSMADVPIVTGDSYRITFDGTLYEVVAFNDPTYGPTIGRMDYSDAPISIANLHNNAWVGVIEPNTSSRHSLTIEHFELD